MYAYLDVSPGPEGSVSTPDIWPIEVEWDVDRVRTPDICAELIDISIEEKVSL